MKSKLDKTIIISNYDYCCAFSVILDGTELEHSDERYKKIEKQCELRDTEKEFLEYVKEQYPHHTIVFIDNADVISIMEGI